MDLKKTEHIIEFYKIKEKWMSLAMTDAAKDNIRQITPYLSEAELLTKLRETTESRKMVEKCGNPPVVSLHGVEKLLEAACKGDCLSISELLKIGSSLTAVGRMKLYLKKGISYEIPLAYYEENL